MNNLVVDFSTLFDSIHVSAFVLGGILYLGWTMLPTLKLLIQPVFQGTSSTMLRFKASDPAEEASLASSSPCTQQPSWSERAHQLLSQTTRRQVAGGGAVLALLIGLALSAHAAIIEQSSGKCPFDIDGPLASAQTFQTAEPYAQSLDVASRKSLQTGSVPEAERWKVGGPGGEIQDSSLRSLKLKSPGAWKYMRRAAPSPSVASPSELLAQAHAATDSSVSWPLLEACVSWVAPSPSEGQVQLSELYAQLECNGELLEAGATTLEATQALLSRSSNLMGTLHSNRGEAASIWYSAQVEWARITHGVFQMNCMAATEQLQTSRRTKASGSGQQAQQSRAAVALSALGSLKKLEATYRQTLAASAGGVKALESRLADTTGSAAAEELKELQKSLAADHTCAVHAMTEGRSVALALPRSAPLVKRALKCRPRMLEEFEALVLSEASESKDPSTMFASGIYYSDIGLAAGQGQLHAPFFDAASQLLPRWLGSSTSEENWAADAGGSHGPLELVKAETLLQASEETSEESEKGERGAARALRLYQHAKMLALKHHDSAAEWRYRVAAELAASHRREKLAAHALGRLGYFLSLRGRKLEALDAVTAALAHSENVDAEKEPLAQYLQVSLRRSLGEMRSTEEVLAAESQLSLVAGKLPSKTLEDQRAAAHTELQWWRLVATEGLQICLHAWDAAQMLICMLCGLVFQLPGAAPEEGN